MAEMSDLQILSSTVVRYLLGILERHKNHVFLLRKLRISIAGCLSPDFWNLLA